MQLSDVEFFYSFIKNSESNIAIKTQDHKFQLYLSYPVSIYLEKSKTNARIK